MEKKDLFLSLTLSFLLFVAAITIPANADDNNVEIHSLATNGDGFQYREFHDNKDVIEGGGVRTCCIWNTFSPGCLWYCKPKHTNNINVEVAFVHVAYGIRFLPDACGIANQSMVTFITDVAKDSLE
ncbi:hypothetical protein PIB30_050955 [Stylosanthes scabra]|uniref:Uncharacterized protein n=1 Tax=Stylosanthes scabra TaxID=79078 RepID=A0ABU6WJE4_9FABA|nr:hypothetical protein [Stylosanthes scabra]